MAVIVDTDIVSFIFKSDTRKELYDPHLAGQFMFISFMTLGELHKWALAWNWGATKNRLLDEYLRRYSIIHSTSDVCRLWAEITDSGRRNGKTIAVADAWIAATALFLNIPLVTHNGSDFQDVKGLSIISEG